MRETNSDTPKHWISSTNRPYTLLAAVWITLGLIFIGMVIMDYASRFFHQISLSYFYTIHLLFVAIGIFYIISASLLFYDSRTIHRNSFPEGSKCQIHPDQYAYDWCAICGKLYCPQDLVRIQQKTWGFSPGMFGFDGVACQNCAKHRVKHFSIIFVILFSTLIPFLVLNYLWLRMMLPIQLIGVNDFIFGAIIIGFLCILFWLLRKLWHLVTTPLTENPVQMKTIEERLTERSADG
jgi:hypothetical protein